MGTREIIETFDKLAPKYRLITNIRQDQDGNWQGQAYCVKPGSDGVTAGGFSPDFDEMMRQMLEKLAAEGITP